MYKGSTEIIAFLQNRKNVKTTLEEVVNLTKLNEDTVRRALEWLKENGYVTVEFSEERNYNKLTAEGREYFLSGKMPEYEMYKKAKQGVMVRELDQSKKEVQIGFNAAMKNGLVGIKEGKLSPLKSEADVEKYNKKYMDIFNIIQSGEEPGDPPLKNELIRRKLIETENKKTIHIEYTGKVFTEIQNFDISVESKNAEIGIEHPLSVITKQIKKIFSELGFQEMEGNIVESSFWNFDALFQPQDHPARELADTFYLTGTILLPDKKIVERVRKAHEIGWKYNWQDKEAQKTVLRTHTTALSARHLAQNYGDKTPKKYFAIGRVFRNEATDYKHLAEFHQVEGIIAWEGATFRDLLGILKEFYKKLGFNKIRFRPSYFPYTEPSLEIEVFFEPRQQWLELGGAGIFRPEVSKPLADTYPVLAWGLSLERPLMLMLGLEDIRTFYRNDLEFLKKTRLR